VSGCSRNRRPDIPEYALYEHFEDYTDEQIADEYKHQIAEDTKSNGGGLVYSAFQVAKSAKIYGDWKRMHKS
jgi:hypothetical protein